MNDKELPQPMTVDEQIKNLKDLHLIIDDEEEAKETLNRISYYRLIKAYGTSLKNRGTGVYKKKASFNDIVKMYEFDNALRYMLFPEFEKIEITLRCRITNHFSVKYGSLGYLDANNFGGNYTDLRTRMDLAIENAANNSPSIKHFIDEYRNGAVPLYAAIEVFSFGTLALFYKTMKTEDQKAIAKQYYKGNYIYLSSWFESVAHVRNVAAHFGRIYQKNFMRLPKIFTPDDSDLEDSNRLFRILCCMRYLMKEYGDWQGFVADLKDLIDEYEGVIKLSGLGMSDGWDRKLLDQEPYNPLKEQIANLNR
jgi:abortive infection bacteriophage resistance protein